MFLNQKGIETIVLDDLSNGHPEAVQVGKLIVGNIGDANLLNKIMKEEQITTVIHFAAFASVPDSVTSPAKYYHNNVTNMQTLLDCCIANNIKSFIFSSSASIFGDPQYTPMDEDHPKQPINPYGMTKLIGESLLADYARAYGLKYCAFRYFCAAGDSQDSSIGEAHDPETHLIPVMINATRKNAPFKVFGNDYATRDGSCIRDFVHVLDLAEAHYLGMKYITENDTSDCFNLGSGVGFSVLEMIKVLENIAGKKVPYVITDRREGDPESLVASYDKANKLLGWVPKHSSINEIITDAWNWENQRKY